MDDLRELRDRLKRAREQREIAEQVLRRTRERLRKAARAEREAGRLDSGMAAERLKELARLKSELSGTIAAQEGELRNARTLELNVLNAQAAPTDPRRSMHHLESAYPLLMLPVRLETRFKTTGPDGRQRHQLWVRIYPDACAVDTFEPTLSEAEVKAAQRYWQEMWRAGGVEADQRAAWRGLVASYGSGRAAWIVEAYLPANPGDAPSKVANDDVILVIAARAALLAPEREALVAYWSAVWRADADADRIGAAEAELRSTVGDPRADELLREYLPFNLDDEPAGLHTRATVTVKVAFLIFPGSVETNTVSWSRAPRVEMLPERFVLLAYQDGNPVLQALGNPIHTPLIVGPDPLAPAEEQIRPQDDGLAVPDELLWMFDFDRAVEWGLGLRIDLTEAQAHKGFDRLIIAGIRLGTDEEESRRQFEMLIQHHARDKAGFELLAQGTPTNNTEASSSGYGKGDDADRSFDRLFKPRPNTVVTEKRDGQNFAELLGIDAAVVRNIAGSDGSDEAEARAMNIALWPATAGYWMETLMRPTAKVGETVKPIFDDETIELTRWFFTTFVSGRGAIPAVRVRRQPYGVLPTTAFSRIGWLGPGQGDGAHVRDPRRAYLAALLALLKLLDADWTEMSRSVSSLGKSGDPHQILLDILGLHPTSAEFHYRTGESLAHLYNRLNLEGLSGALIVLLLAAGGEQLLQRAGYSGPRPEILSKVFLDSQGPLDGPLIDDAPLSESEGIRDWTPDHRNYIRWLVDAAKTSLDALRLQQGFLNDEPPTALLYLLLRHALQLGYKGAEYKFKKTAGFPASTLAVLRQEPDFIHVATSATSSESRYASLFRPEPGITGDAGLSMGDHITRSLFRADAASHLGEQLQALELLANAPTARLERALVEHLDCCSYRFDAWLLGLVRYQLSTMRYQSNGERINVRKGLYIGAYGWLEDVRTNTKTLALANVGDELGRAFGAEPPLMQDAASAGYIHAPSLDQAVTAAILRNGYLSNAGPANPKTLAVNLSSERVRLALSMLEGMRNGQSLGALLGYRFERGLHDRHMIAETDRFIRVLRKVFPLRADRLMSTKTEPGVPIEAIEARNVVDGLKLVEHVKKTGVAAYPFGLTLPDAVADPGQAAAINREVDRLLDIHDAVADLAVAESVHQAVKSNVDRAGATLDAYAAGGHPPEPDIIRTPNSGVVLTHRVGLHLEAGLAAATDAPPRAIAEPAIDAWLRNVLPPLSTIACRVTWIDPASDAAGARAVTMADLGLSPMDLVTIVRTDRQQAMSELDDRIVLHVLSSETLRPDTPLQIQYMEADPGQVSLFEVLPLICSMRSLVQRCRPLRPSDIAPASETREQLQTETLFVDPQRIAAVLSRLDGLAAAIDSLQGQLTALVEGLPASANELATAINGLGATAVQLLSDAARFGIAQSGWGFAVAWQRSQFATVIGEVRALVERWNRRLADWQASLAAYTALPAGTPPEGAFKVLRAAERAVSTAYAPLPSNPEELRETIVAKHTAFVTRLAQFADLTRTTVTSLPDLLNATRALLPVSDFDLQPPDIEKAENSIATFAADLVAVLRAVRAEVEKRRLAARAELAVHDSAALDSVRVEALERGAKALLGEEFRIVPEFTVSGARASEWQTALGDTARSDLLRYLTETVKTDLPVDTWLYGMARVRENMRLWEEVVMHAGAFGRPEPDLMPMQLPYRLGEPWLALDFPAATDLAGERLLYTAHYATPFDTSRRQCGLLVDEWTEVLQKTDDVLDGGRMQRRAMQDTGLAFHFDRPNSEPPQTMLLVTPASRGSGWLWEDVVGALNDTLNLAKKRAVEPAQLDTTDYARFLPATVLAMSLRGLSISTMLGINSQGFTMARRTADG